MPYLSQLNLMLMLYFSDHNLMFHNLPPCKVQPHSQLCGPNLRSGKFRWRQESLAKFVYSIG